MTDPYRIRSPETWNRARTDYLDGATAEEVCRRYDIGLSALRTRAREEGWRRADAPDPAPAADDVDEFATRGITDLVDMAFSRLAQALSHGRAADAARWERIHRALHERAAEEARDDAEAQRLAELWIRRPDARPTHAAPRLDARGLAVGDVHDLHPEILDQAPANRAERRRAAREERRRG